MFINPFETKFRSPVNKLNFLYLPPREVCLITGCGRSGTTAMAGWLGQSKKTVVFNEIKITKAANKFLREVYRHRMLFENRHIMHKQLRFLIYKYINNQRFIWNKIVIFKAPISPELCDFIENMEKVFPDLKIIYMMRHPINVINSMRKRLWGYSLRGTKPKQKFVERGIEEWKFNANQCIKMKDKQNIFVCKFEDLVQNSDHQSQRIKEFLKIKRLEPFTPKETKKVMLEDGTAQEILNETKEERTFFGYD